jgi:hypothetical protein
MRSGAGSSARIWLSRGCESAEIGGMEVHSLSVQRAPHSWGRETAMIAPTPTPTLMGDRNGSFDG